MKLIAMEFYKLRRRKIFLMITAFLSIEMLWAFMSVSIYLSKNNNNHVWEHIITTVASMNGLFLPILCSIICSRICDIENKGNTWKLLISTNINRPNIYLAKYICCSILLVFTAILQSIFIIGIGYSKGTVLGNYSNIIVQSLIGTILTTVVILTLQQWITLTFKNQAFALCFGMLGGFIGLVSVLLPSSIRTFIIWSYYTELCPIKMNFAYKSIDFVSTGLSKLPITLALCQGILLFIIGSIIFSRKEV